MPHIQMKHLAVVASCLALLAVAAAQAAPKAAAPAPAPKAAAPAASPGKAAAPNLCDPNARPGIQEEAGAKGLSKPASTGSRLYLYVWAGIEGAVGQSASSTPQPRDFVATLDVTPNSPCFGKVIAESEVPTSGNEPHHVGLSLDGSVLGVGGFNSWRFKQPSLYFFDVKSDPSNPKFIKAITPTQGAVADDFIRLPNGGFVVSLMGNTEGGSSGRVAEIDGSLNLVAEHPKSGKNTDGFNPHGLALTPAPINRMVTLDYVEYASTFKPSAKVNYRTTARIWDQKEREIIKVIDLGSKAKGLMTARYIPNVGNNALFFISAGQGQLHLLDSLSGEVKQAYDAKVGNGHCVLTLPFRNSTRIAASIYTSDQIRLLDIGKPASLKDLQNIDLPKGTGPHAIVIAPGEKLIAVSNYYVQHDGPSGPATLGAVAPFNEHAAKTIRLFTVAADGNSLSPHPKLPDGVIDFKNLFPHRGIARPHGMAFKAVTPSRR